LPEFPGINMDGAGKEKKTQHDLYKNGIEVDASDERSGVPENTGLNQTDAEDGQGRHERYNHDADNVR